MDAKEMHTDVATVVVIPRVPAMQLLPPLRSLSVMDLPKQWTPATLNKVAVEVVIKSMFTDIVRRGRASEVELRIGDAMDPQ